MPARRQRYIVAALPTPYRSTACRIGTHPACAESAPTLTPGDLPLVYEACDCPCHSADKSAPAEVQQ